jgi:4'-phosphopantetheinyl transferase
VITINYLKVKKSHLQHLDSFLNTIPASAKKKLLQLHQKEDQLRSVISRILLKKQLIELGYANTILNKIKIDKNGRPYIDNIIDFNIAHSANYVICAISKQTRVGIDIEKIRKIKLDNFNVFLSKEELKEIQASKNPNRQFFILWAKKEAVSKADGQGLGTLLPSIHVKKKSAICNKQKWNLSKLSINNNYSSFIAFKGNQKITIKELNIKDLLNI